MSVITLVINYMNTLSLSYWLRLISFVSVKSYLSCRDAHRDVPDSMDLLFEVLIDLSELVDL